MIIHGLDLSLAATGYAFGDDLAETAIVSTPHGGILRLAHIRDQLRAFYAPADLVMVEGMSFASKGAMAHEIGALSGVVKVRMHDDMVPFGDVPPASLKKFATDNGGAKKADLILAAYKNAGVELRDDNRCDAWWLRQIGLYACEPGVCLVGRTAYRDAVVSKLVWPAGIEVRAA